MILSGREIKKQVESGDIKISDFNEKRLNPNSYNLRLHNELAVYEEPLDMKKPSTLTTYTIPDEGTILFPGRLYLARTMEYTETDKFVPMLEGRSSVGRLGIFVHVTAGFGDVGFKGYWTLEIHCVEPVKIYPGVDICQIYYHTIMGDYDLYNSGKYQRNSGIQPSLMYKDFKEG